MGTGASASATGDQVAALLDKAEDKDLDAYSKDKLTKEQRKRLVKALVGDQESLKDFLETAPDMSQEDADAKIKEHEAMLTKESPEETMIRVLKVQALKLVRPSWMLEQPADWLFQRMQDLPTDAFAENAEWYAKIDWMNNPVRSPIFEVPPPAGVTGPMTVVSYGWFSKAHPDPKGFHVKRIRWFFEGVDMPFYHDDGHEQSTVRISMGDVMTMDCSMIAINERHCMLGNAFFLDFMSLPQSDSNGNRSVQDLTSFKIGLSIINFLYGGKQTIVVKMTNMADAPFEGMNDTLYHVRGWCTFEETTAGIVKPINQILDLGPLDPFLELDAATYIDQVKFKGFCKGRGKGKSDCDPSSLARSQNPPPVTPARMAAILQEKKFTNGADKERVAKFYKTFFEKMVTRAKEIRLVGPCKLTGEIKYSSWGIKEAQQLAEVLPEFTCCESLAFCGRWNWGHDFGDEGILLLGPALAKMPALKKVNLRFCGFGEEGLAALFEALTSSSTLEEYSLPIDVVGKFGREGGLKCCTRPQGPRVGNSFGRAIEPITAAGKAFYKAINAECTAETPNAKASRWEGKLGKRHIIIHLSIADEHDWKGE